MFKFSITDRRLNPSGKNLTNRQRFLERVKHSVREAANKQIKGRKIDDQSDAEVSISRDGIEEPTFNYDTTKGFWDVVLPGNRDFIVGDTIAKPPAGGGGGTQGAPDGGGDDDFRFYISYEEFVNAILEDLSLPDMVKASEKETISFSMRRAGYTTVGSASNLALERTMIMGIARRISLKTPKLVRIRELEFDLVAEEDEERRQEIEDEIEELHRRAEAITFLEKADLRYNNFVKQPNPMTRAVMFLVMDVSGSMGEREKTIAKKYFVLLYLFLRRKYKDIDVVFIRHHHTAEECDQETFFTKPETGGTIVSTAYDEVYRVIRERYPISEWNIYLAQASDGDNTESDNHACQVKLGGMLPWMQYATYIEVGREHTGDYFQSRDSALWKMMDGLKSDFANLALRRITDENQVIETFRSLFQSKAKAAA
jgi:uncharacterized sporulation protein YeaH/YhbH (DUF444 family)